MEETIQSLEGRRRKLYRRLAEVGDFRRGTISVNYRKCGNKKCACARPEHPGHGPQYLWNTTRGTKSLAENLPLGPRLEKAKNEQINYRLFVELTKQIVEVNEKICRLRPVREIKDQQELDELKKKLRRQFSRKSGRK